MDNDGMERLPIPVKALGVTLATILPLILLATVGHMTGISTGKSPVAAASAAGQMLFGGLAVFSMVAGYLLWSAHPSGAVAGRVFFVAFLVVVGGWPWIAASAASVPAARFMDTQTMSQQLGGVMFAVASLCYLFFSESVPRAFDGRVPRAPKVGRIIAITHLSVIALSIGAAIVLPALRDYHQRQSAMAGTVTEPQPSTGNYFDKYDQPATETAEQFEDRMFQEAVQRFTAISANQYLLTEEHAPYFQQAVQQAYQEMPTAPYIDVLYRAKAIYEDR